MKIKITTTIGEFYIPVNVHGFGDDDLQEIVENLEGVQWMEAFNELNEPVILPKALLLQSGFMLV